MIVSISSIRAVFTLCLFAAGNLLIYAQWTQQVSGTDYDLNSVYFINSNTGFIGTSRPVNPPGPYGGEILRTTNGGNNWTQVLFDTNFRVNSFQFIDANTGFAAGGYYSVQGRIFRTTNGGITWNEVTPIGNPYFIFSIVFPNSSTGYFSGPYDIWKTTDSGINWTRIFFQQTNNYTWGKLSFIDFNTGFYARDSGLVFKTTNAGLNWQSSLLPNQSAFRDIKFINANTGIIIGGLGLIHKTTDQGVSWFSLNSGTTQDLFSVFFTNDNTGYVTTVQTVIKTTNSGNSWFNVFTLPPNLLLGSYFIDPSTGYVCGAEGKVYKTTTGGVIGINNIGGTVPKEFLLYQNYPNPFNPSTSIKFAVPKSSVVKMLLFDALGREIETLVNENLDPGTYEVSWDASKYSSGIYFYRILAGDFVSVKKMSFIK